MKNVLITIKNFETRFPQAVEYFISNGIIPIYADSIASMTEKEKQDKVYNAEALFAAADTIDKQLLQKMHKIKIISRMGSGMDNIDLEYCKQNNIRVTNSKGCNSNAVAEMTLLLILAVLRNLRCMVTAAEEGNWNERTAVNGEELWGKTVGIVGFGGIARRLAELLRGFNTKLLAYDPFMNYEEAKRLNVTPVSFDEILKSAEIITVHIPSTAENDGLFNENLFRKMEKHPYFINCSRGALVIEDDLYHALKNNQLKAAATDVWNKEPLENKNKLFSLKNFIGTPHIAGMSTKSAIDDSMTVASSIVAYFNNQKINNVII